MKLDKKPEEAKCSENTAKDDVIDILRKENDQLKLDLDKKKKGDGEITAEERVKLLGKGFFGDNTMENFDVDAGAETDDSPTRAWKEDWKTLVANGDSEPRDHPDPGHPYNTDRLEFI